MYFRLINLARMALSISLVLGLSACAHLTGFGTDNAPEPTPLVNFTPQLRLTPLWSVNTGVGTEGTYLKLMPAYAEGKIFTADQKGRVTAIDSATGRTHWQVDLKSSITGGVSAGEGLVVLGTADAHVIALNMSDGRIVWRTSVVDQALALPRIAHGRVLVKTMEGTLFALHARTGKILWDYDHGSPSLVLRTSSAPQVANGIVVTGYADGKLEAVRLSDGRLLWEQVIASPKGFAEVERMVDIDADPFIANGIVYVATYQGQLAAVSLQSGRILWHRKISSYAGLTLSERLVLVSDTAGRLWAFNRATGKVVWQQMALKARAITGPAIMDGTVVVGDGESYLHWMSLANGHFMARTAVNKSPLVAPPLVVGKTLYIYTTKGMLAAYQIQ